MVPGEVMEPTTDLKMGDSKCAGMPVSLSPGERDIDVTGRVRVNSGTNSLSESMGVGSRAQEEALISREEEKPTGCPRMGLITSVSATKRLTVENSQD